MKHMVAALLASLLLHGCGETPSNTTQHDQNVHDHSTHDHQAMIIDELVNQENVPSIKLSIEEDPMSGWNVHIQTEHFEFAPERVNTEPKVHEGHAHLYVDNYKMARVYSSWYHLKKLTPGEHQIRVVLNANNHSALSYQNQDIAASVRIVQK